MKEITLAQNTPEWLDYRRTRIGASDASIIMGLSPWSTPYDLYQSKVNGIDKKQTWAMNRGKELEPAARDLFEKTMMVKVSPKVVQHDKLDWMIASLDGISDDGKTLVEIKCPASISSHMVAASGEIPVHYKAQMQHQMYVTGVKKMLYFSYFDGDSEVLELERDEAFIKKMLQDEKKFYECMQSFTPPDNTGKQDLVLENSDDFIAASEKYKEIDIAIKLLTEEKELTREKLIEIASDRNVKGNGISVSKKKTEGRLDYKSMPAAFRDEIEKFRAPATQSWCVRIG